MNSRGVQAIIVAIGTVVALMIVMFPDWNAVHHSNSALTTPLGHAWMLSPPLPKGLDSIRVELGSYWRILAISVIAVSVLLCLALEQPRRK
jgi:hypothetical protein